MDQNRRRGMTRGGPRYGKTDAEIAEARAANNAALAASGKMSFAMWKLTQARSPGMNTNTPEWKHRYNEYLASGGRRNKSRKQKASRKHKASRKQKASRSHGRKQTHRRK